MRRKFDGESGIIYCPTVKKCIKLKTSLNKAGFYVKTYHAKMKDKEREKVYHEWMDGSKLKVIIATIAFGMGIDKKDVRFIIHIGMSKSIENYY